MLIFAEGGFQQCRTRRYDVFGKWAQIVHVLKTHSSNTAFAICSDCHFLVYVQQQLFSLALTL